MEAAQRFEPTQAREDPNDRIRLHGVSWAQYETLLSIRGESAGVRIAYLRGEVELMSPSHQHESIGSLIGRLIEAYADARHIDINAYGSWTLKKKVKERGAEPDKCYALGSRVPRVPDFLIEVVWTSGGLDKLDLYAGLSVPEVWFWRRGRIEIYLLHGGGYQRAQRSAALPGLDIDLVARLAARKDQSQAVREFRAALGT